MYIKSTCTSLYYIKLCESSHQKNAINQIGEIEAGWLHHLVSRIFLMNYKIMHMRSAKLPLTYDVSCILL